MASISQIRGALLEEAVLYLLGKYGYQTIECNSSINEEGLRQGHSGMEVRGRGSWHQIDALAGLRPSPVFMYPLRLMVEAKCYKRTRPVGIEVVRNAVGVLKDISENYFSVTRSGSSIQAPRFNYHTAIFSTSGYTNGAIDYAIAQQAFLIQYHNIPVIEPLIEAIMSFDESCVTALGKRSIQEVRERYRSAIKERIYSNDTSEFITQKGSDLIDNSLATTLTNIRGSYFGMLQGRWPLHLLMREELHPYAFESDVVNCHVSGYESGEWKFTPAALQSTDDGWFELEFNLPAEIAKLVKDNWGDRVAVANIKQQHFSYIDLTGIIGGIYRSVRLNLDQDWINRYIERVRIT